LLATNVERGFRHFFEAFSPDLLAALVALGKSTFANSFERLVYFFEQQWVTPAKLKYEALKVFTRSRTHFIGQIGDVDHPFLIERLLLVPDDLQLDFQELVRQTHNLIGFHYFA
jgi:hypothetical protein